MSWRGKLVGVLVGLLLGASLRRPWLLIVGLVLGHLYDRGAFGGGTRAEAPSGDARPDDPFAVRGLAAVASVVAMERAWRGGLQAYHPDRVANAAPELRELAERRAREANAAWETIRRQRKP